MKWKVGDKLRIKTFEEDYYPEHWTSEMISFNGKIVTIRKVYNRDYRLEEYGYYWNDKDFEIVVEMDKFDIEEFEI